MSQRSLRKEDFEEKTMYSYFRTRQTVNNAKSKDNNFGGYYANRSFLSLWDRIRQKKFTETEFLNLKTNDSKSYLKDSIKLLDQLNIYLQNHSESFHGNIYYDSTKIVVDTILYSSDLNRLALFVVTKNPTNRQLSPSTEHEWYYDAFCYMAIRIPERNSFELKWLRNFYPINFYNEKEVSSLIREMYFTEFATIIDSSGASIFKYNLNDKRFWDSPVWQKYFKSLH